MSRRCRTLTELLRGSLPWAVLLTLGVCLVPGADAVAQVDCGQPDILCVDDDPGDSREFSTIQKAVNKARAGDTVVVFAGDYAGFRMKRSGKPGRPIVVTARKGARIVASEQRSDDGIYLQRTSHVVVSGFDVRADGMKFGIGTHDATPSNPMRGVEIRGNTVRGADSTNIYLSEVADSLIVDNVAMNSRGSHGIYLANAGSDDTVLRGNVCSGNAKNGIHFNGDASVGGDGIHTGILVDGNVLYENAANGIDADGLRRSRIVNNLIYDNGRHGLRAFAIDASAGPARLEIFNNTFAGNAAWAVKLTQDGGGHTISNNILLSKTGGLAVDADLVADYNVGDTFSLDGENTVIGLAAWRAAGYGANTIAASRGKLFRKPNKGDYSLKPRSPARDSGTPALGGVAAPAHDIDGALRPAGERHDRGAYEFGAVPDGRRR